MAEKKVKTGEKDVGSQTSTAKTTTSAKDDNIIAALAHALVVFAAILAPLVIWLVYKDKSKYVKNQAMQALVYQAAGGVLFFLVFMFVMVLSVVTMGFGAILIPFVFLLVIPYVLYGFFGAYKCYQGEDFKYVFIGDLVAKKMQ